MKHVLVCDDDPYILETVKSALIDFEEIRLHPFLEPEDALEYALSKPVDIAFLDIIMPGMTGIVLAKSMRAHSFTGDIVFLTSSNDFAAESYAVKAAGYILKPATKTMVRESYLALCSGANQGEPYLSVVTKQMITRILYSELLYLESNGKQLHFCLRSGDTVTITGAIKDYRKILTDDKRFAVPHTSYVVNMDFIKTVLNQDIIMINEQKIPISRRQVSFKKEYLNYIAKG